jgi:hypothetical protein
MERVMSVKIRANIGPVLCGVTLLLSGAARADAGAARYPSMAPLEQYQMTSEAEIVLARSAAPPSVSGDAEVLVLGNKGYQTAVKGKNGFVCLVVRSWFAGFDHDEFWNPNLRSPNCFNPPSVRSVVQNYLERTKWVLAGVPKADMFARTKDAIASHQFALPEAGAMTFMMSKAQFTSDADKHWHPHLMFFVADSPPKAWGANLPGTGIYGDRGEPDPITIYIVPVPKWSDGEPDEHATR